MRARGSLRWGLAFVFSLWLATPVEAQEASATVTASTLLNSGFEIVATNYLANSIVITLQRSNRAFLCELGFDGQTARCIEIK